MLVQVINIDKRQRVDEILFEIWPEMRKVKESENYSFPQFILLITSFLTAFFCSSVSDAPFSVLLKSSVQTLKW